MTSLSKYAENEMRLAGLFSKDSAYDGMLAEAVMKMINLFEEEGHSGASAPMAIHIFSRVALFEPLTPLTGEDDEWNEVGPSTFQNRRCSHVFKDADGAYDINGCIFREPSGVCFTNKDSRVPIKFPYMPKVEYVDVEGEQT